MRKLQGLVRRFLVLASVFFLLWFVPVTTILAAKGNGIPLNNFLIMSTAGTHLFWFFVLRKLP